ncbi:Low conductance mechanosensitive channel YnaI [Posidoniimonas corsicana]|uniref:Low conductance mechanosensitive channel YnaI n=1 Tax=Posidoniimonas corsicana TaxID=1938618 RepID=A0A5C5UUF5_9BACT|nr:mechanosensitive ion channel family protein [Posidoniimonas corsicana]TWT29213.1 Low conductance mechanosensitive channel YnaI [Posidoniimonas corsicana]
MTEPPSRLRAGCVKHLRLVAAVWVLAIGPPLAAQESPTSLVADTTSPRDTLQSFITACNELDRRIRTDKRFDRSDPLHLAVAEMALDCIDDSEIPAYARAEKAGEVAVCLKEILDRAELPPWDEIPDAEQIAEAGGMEQLSYYRIPNTRITIARVEDGPRRHEYLFTPGTVELAQPYYEAIKGRPYRTSGPPVSKGFYRWYLSAPGNEFLARVVDRLPEGVRVGRTLGLANWKWIGLLVTTAASLAVMVLCYRLQIRLTQRAAERSLLGYWLTLALPVTAALSPLALRYVAHHYLTLRSLPLYVVDFAAILTAILAATVVIFGFSNRLAATVISSRYINSAGLNAQLIRIVSRLASLFATVTLWLVGGQYLGIPVATLLASAGIGGVAVALGSQDTLRTLFGTLNLLADKPFRVGDRIIFKGYDGVVEDIGLRSTCIQLLSGHQVKAPNDQLANADIENVKRRPYIRRTGRLMIPINSGAEKVERAVVIVRDLLRDHEGMDPERPPRVYLDEFTPEGFVVEFNYWYSPPDYWEFKAFGDRLNLAILRGLEVEAIPLSLPQRHSFWKQDDAQGPLDVQVVGAAEG